MAIYGVDLYGLTTYGPTAPAIDFKVAPFSASPNGYNSLRVTWTSPSGDWTEQRLVKSKSGYPSGPDDGTVVVSTSGAASEYVDTDLQDGAWYYYALWMNTSTGWQRGGVCSGLSVGPKKMQDILLAKVPEFFKFMPSTDPGTVVWEPSSANIVNPNALATENVTLKTFLGILGWGLDYLQDYHQTLMSAMDPNQMHVEDLAHLAATFGIEFEPMVPGSLMRKRVANAGALAKQGGTLDGLRAVIADTVGWDLDLAVTPNLFLTEDQSTFTDPQYPLWDSTTNYPVGVKVLYDGWVYQSLLAPAIGSAPPSSLPYPSGGESNSTWSNVTATENFTLNSPAISNHVSDWAVSVPSTSIAIQVGPLGLSAQVDGTVLNVASNALQMTGVSTVLSAFTMSCGNSVTSAIPLPSSTPWDPTVEYVTGSFVTYDGVSWKALRQQSGITPGGAGSDAWQQAGIDSRVPVQFSYFTYSTATLTGDQIPLLAPTFLDAAGNTIAYTTTPPGFLFYDTLRNHGDSLTTGLSGDVDYVTSPASTMLWTVPVSWGIEEGVMYPTPGGGGQTATLVVPTNTALDDNTLNTAVSFTVPHWDAANQFVTIKQTEPESGGFTTAVVGQNGLSGASALVPPLADGERVTLVWDENGGTSVYTVVTLIRPNGATQSVTLVKPAVVITGGSVSFAPSLPVANPKVTWTPSGGTTNLSTAPYVTLSAVFTASSSWSLVSTNVVAKINSTTLPSSAVSVTHSGTNAYKVTLNYDLGVLGTTTVTSMSLQISGVATVINTITSVVASDVPLTTTDYQLTTSFIGSA